MLVKQVDRTQLIALFKQAKSEDKKHARKTYEKILKQLSWIPASLASKYRRYENYQDLLQTGYLTLFKAMLAYDYEKSSNISGYIYPWVKSEIAKEAWGQKEYLQTYSFVGDSKPLVTTTIGSPEDEYIRGEDIKILKNILKNLDMDSKKVLTETFDLEGKGKKSLRQIAKEMNISHEQVRKIQHKAIKKIVKMRVRYGKVI